MTPPNNINNNNNNNNGNIGTTENDCDSSNGSSNGNSSTSTNSSSSSGNGINSGRSFLNSSGNIPNNSANIAGEEFVCPHCNTIYSSKNLINENLSSLNKCSHLLMDYQTTSHFNATYRTASDLTANILGNKIPLVIAKRFIKYIKTKRDSKSGTPSGFYTVHQSRARVSNTFPGITSFSLRYVIKDESNSNNNNNSSTSSSSASSTSMLSTKSLNSKTTTIESNYFLTQNPVQDSTLFESFVLNNYIDSIPSLQAKINCLNEKNNNNSFNNKEDVAYIGFSREQIKTFLEFDDQDANFSSLGYFSKVNGADCDKEDDEIKNNNNNNNNHSNLLNYRWVLITGLPNTSIPTFLMLTSQLILENTNLQFPINIKQQQQLSSVDVNVYGIFPLPNIAIQS